MSTPTLNQCSFDKLPNELVLYIIDEALEDQDFIPRFTFRKLKEPVQSPLVFCGGFASH